MLVESPIPISERYWYNNKLSISKCGNNNEIHFNKNNPNGILVGNAHLKLNTVQNSESLLYKAVTENEIYSLDSTIINSSKISDKAVDCAIYGKHF